MRFNFLLSNYKGYFVLQNFINKYGSGRIESIFISKDRHILNDFSNEIIEICNQYNLDYQFTLNKLNNEVITFVIGWRKIIKNYKNLIVLHDSLLPKYSGFQPTVNSLINGQKYIGSTAFKAVEIFDQGPIITSRKVKVKYPVKIEEAIHIQARMYWDIISKITYNLLNGKSIKYKKNTSSVKTYSPWRDEMDYIIDWSLSADEIVRFVNAVGYPYKGAQTKLNGDVIFVSEVEKIKLKSVLNHFGKVAYFDNDKPVIIAGKDFIKIISAADESGNSVLPFDRLKVRLG